MEAKLKAKELFIAIEIMEDLAELWSIDASDGFTTEEQSAITKGLLTKKTTETY